MRNQSSVKQNVRAGNREEKEKRQKTNKKNKSSLSPPLCPNLLCLIINTVAQLLCLEYKHSYRIRVFVIKHVELN